jgi:hypothetical protein
VSRATLIHVQEVEAAKAEAARVAEAARERRELLRDAFVDELEVDDLVNVVGPRWAAVLEIGGAAALSMLREYPSC